MLPSASTAVVAGAASDPSSGTVSTERVEKPAKSTGRDTSVQAFSGPSVTVPPPDSRTKSGIQSASTVSATTSRLNLSARSSPVGLAG